MAIRFFLGISIAAATAYGAAGGEGRQARTPGWGRRRGAAREGRRAQHGRPAGLGSALLRAPAPWRQCRVERRGSPVLCTQELVLIRGDPHHLVPCAERHLPSARPAELPLAYELPWEQLQNCGETHIQGDVQDGDSPRVEVLPWAHGGELRGSCRLLWLRGAQLVRHCHAADGTSAHSLLRLSQLQQSGRADRAAEGAGGQGGGADCHRAGSAPNPGCP